MCEFTTISYYVVSKRWERVSVLQVEGNYASASFLDHMLSSKMYEKMSSSSMYERVFVSIA